MKVFPLLVVVCVAAGGAQAKQHRRPAKAQPEAEAAAPAPFGAANGAWTLESSTTVGNCPGLIPSSVQIVDNKIVAEPGSAVAAWGYVDESGAIVARFTAGGAAEGQGERVARFHGSLRSGKGSGAWSSSTDMCGGTWRAMRSGAATVAAPAAEPAPAEPAAPAQTAPADPFN